MEVRMEKQEALVALEREMRADEGLPLQTNLVFGEGSANPRAFFIGEAPGMTEDIQKRPFVGRAGQLLRKCIREIGWKEEEVYITNIVKRRPPDNRDPLPEEIVCYAPYLARQIEIINPPALVTLGRFSMNYFLPTAKITRDQGKPFRIADGRLVVPLFHPAAALRGTGVMNQFKESFRRVPEIMENATLIAEKAAAAPARAEVSSRLF